MGIHQERVKLWHEAPTTGTSLDQLWPVKYLFKHLWLVNIRTGLKHHHKVPIRKGLNPAFIYMSCYGPAFLPDWAWIKTVKTCYIARAKEWVKDQEEEPSTKKYKWNEYVQVWIINKQKRLVNGEWEKLPQTI